MTLPYKMKHKDHENNCFMWYNFVSFLCIPQDYHSYYNTEIVSGGAKQHWHELAFDSKHETLSDSPGGYDVSHGFRIGYHCPKPFMSQTVDDIFLFLFFKKIGFPVNCLQLVWTAKPILWRKINNRRQSVFLQATKTQTA